MEFLIRIIFSIFEMMNYIFCYQLLFQMKLKKDYKVWILFFFGLIAVHSYAIYTKSSMERFDIDFFYGLLIPLLLLDEKRWKGACLYIDVMLASTIFNICIGRGVALFMDVPYKNTNVISAVEVVQNSLFSLFAVMILLYIKVIRKKEIQKLEYTLLQYIFITAGLFGISVMIGFVELLLQEQEVTVKIVNAYEFYSALACIVFILVAMWLSVSIKRNAEYKKEKEMLKLYMEKQEEYIHMVIDKDTQMRHFRHDIKGHMTALHSYLQNQEMEKAAEYIEKIEYVAGASTVKNYTGITAVDAIIHDMTVRMQQQNIKLVWEGTIPMDCPVSTFDLCTIFMNVLKNGVEACEKLSGERIIYMYINSYNGKLYVKEKNKITGELQLDERGNLKTNKADKKNHGFGTENIRQVVEQYHGYMEYQVKEGWFSVEIIL